MQFVPIKIKSLPSFDLAVLLLGVYPTDKLLHIQMACKYIHDRIFSTRKMEAT